MFDSRHSWSSVLWNAFQTLRVSFSCITRDTSTNHFALFTNENEAPRQENYSHVIIEKAYYLF
jgi:hypothetical protein